MNERKPIDVDSFREELENRKVRAMENGLGALSPRKLEEQQFHDDRLDDTDPSKGQTPNRKYYSVTTLSQEYINGWIRTHAPGKVFLDFVCGTGGIARKAARMGSRLSIGIDISHASIERADRATKEAGLTKNTIFLPADCENTGLPDNSIDVIICAGVLHHMDVSYAFPELRRILKPGGVILAAEALAYNPLIQLYRRLTPKYRTDWEKRHILTLRDVRFAKRFFTIQNVRYWHLFALLARPFLHTRLFSAVLAIGNAINRVVLRIPPVCCMAWSFTFEMVKPKNA